MRFRFLVLLIPVVAFTSCQNTKVPVTDISDYEKYMTIDQANARPSFQRISKDIDFWGQRLAINPEDAISKVSLAGLYSARFRSTGDMSDLYTSDSLFLDANLLFKTSTSGIYRSLAANCITRHKFRQAQLYLDTALALGDDKYLTYLMRCDVLMELGHPDMAQRALNQISQENSFDFLIRKAKLLDQAGDIDAAIKKMEMAKEKAIESGNEMLILWATSNLGDMYGHANRLKDAYQCYLEVLERKPDYLYALKGIAWLAFSHDKNIPEAKRIIAYLAKIHPVPDYDLMLAEIASYENDHVAAEALEKRFMIRVNDHQFGEIYNTYIFDILVEENKNIDKALAIARAEVNNRPCSQSYDLLAWAFYKAGKTDEALEIAKTYVEKRNHEPEAIYHLGVIYAASGNRAKARYYFEQAGEAAFELGPVKTIQIERYLKDL